MTLRPVICKNFYLTKVYLSLKVYNKLVNFILLKKLLKSIVKKLLFWPIAAIVIISLIISFLEYQNILSWKQVYNTLGITEVSSSSDNYPLSVHFIDVGKADSIFIKCDEKNILIDAGEKTTYNVVKEYLKRNNVKSLDLVVATHPHSDHIGGLPDIINSYKIKRFLMPKIKDELVPTARCYEKLLLALREKKIYAENPIPGDSFDIGDLNFKVLAPKEDNNYENINDFSVVLKMTYKDHSFLFTGDAQSTSENDMRNTGLDLSADVLKVGHHGSKTSTTAAFLNKVNPKYAVICVADDKYKLPKKVILDRIKNKNIEIFRTDLDGSIVFASDGHEFNIFKEK